MWPENVECARFGCALVDGCLPHYQLRVWTFPTYSWKRHLLSLLQFDRKSVYSHERPLSDSAGALSWFGNSSETTMVGDCEGK